MYSSSQYSGLGKSFAFLRGSRRSGGWLSDGHHALKRQAQLDLTAVIHLDEVRTQDLYQSRVILGEQPERLYEMSL